jgi:O-antigen ligase
VTPPASIGTRLFQSGFVLLALFVPFSIAGANIAIGLAALGWILWNPLRPGARPRPDALAVAAVALVVAAIPSVVLSENTARAWKDWGSYWEILICFLVGAHIARVRVRETACAVLVVSSTVACLVAFVQRAGGLHVGPLHIGAEHRVGGTLFTMTFAGILYQLIAFFASVALSSSAARVRAWLALAVVAQFVALMLTMTRGAWVGVVAGLVVVCIVLRSRVLALASALGLAALLVFSSLYANDQGRTIAVSELVTSEADRNVSTRLVLWDMSWDMFRDHPLFGVGMGDYSLEAEARLEQRKVRTTVDSHNVFLQVLATRGLVGFLPFAAFFAVLVRSLWSIAAASERGSLARHYAAGALGATAAILAGALTENNVDDSEVFIALMFLVGVARSALYPPAAGERA